MEHVSNALDPTATLPGSTRGPLGTPESVVSLGRSPYGGVSSVLMHLRIFCVLMASVLLASACAASRGASPDAAQSAGKQAALVAAAEHFLRVFDNLEFEPFEAAWSSSRSVFFPFRDTPERVEGAAVGERFRSFFAEVRSTRPGPPFLHLQPRELRVEVVGDAGLVTFMLGRAPGDVSRRTLLFVRERGAWKLRHMHASNMLAADPPK